jgi:hypothetical protein
MAEDTVYRVKDGRSWRIGSAEDIGWIVRGTEVGLAITSGIPPVFAAYATILVPAERGDLEAQDQAALALLRRQSPDQPWWLGYLDTGADDLIFPDAPKVTLYSNWRYVLVEAGPDQAAMWKDASSWRGPLPDLIFPADRAWLLSTLWDDEWRCLGGPADLVEAFQRDPLLQARPVVLGEDATPPGYQAR